MPLAPTLTLTLAPTPTLTPALALALTLTLAGRRLRLLGQAPRDRAWHTLRATREHAAAPILD